MTISKLKRVFGFSKDHAGIMSRFLNEENNWADHLYKTKEFILETAVDKGHGICLIIGSGWCLDVPVEELSKQFEKVILADIIHPRQIEHRIKKFSNVELLSVDVSGILENLYVYKKNIKTNINLFDYLRKNDENFVIKKYNPDFVISVNILSQLSYFPVKYIKKYKLASETEQLFIRKMIEKRHLEMLPKGKSILITDYFEQEYNFVGHLINEQHRLSITLPAEKIKKEWIWDFDLSGNYHTGNSVKFKVAALQV